MQKKKITQPDIEKQTENQGLDESRIEKELVQGVAVVKKSKSSPAKKLAGSALKSISSEGSEPIIEPSPQQIAGSENSGNSIAAAPITSGKNSRLLIIGAISGGVLAGFLICYLLLLVPLQNQITGFTSAFTSDSSFSNQMKSDLSTTKLKQQEMEIRYHAVSEQLESANQYIFLLRMKEQIAVAHLMVEQKEGLKARQSLSEIQNRFDHLKPFILKKDVVAAEKLEELIKESIQHLVSDPESIKTDLTAISDQLNNIEKTLFQPE